MISTWSGSSLSLLIFESEPLLLVKWILFMVVFLVVTFALIGAGAYVFLRVFSSRVRKWGNEWEATAAELGLKVDESGPLSPPVSGVKPLEGVYRGHNVKIVSFRFLESAVEPITYANHISCEISFSPAFAVPFEITSQTRYIKALRSAFGSNGIEIGVPAFDKLFRVVSPDPDSMRKILVFEPNEPGLPRLLTEMVRVQNRNHTIEFSHTCIKISAPADNTDASRIRSIMDDSVDLTDHMHAAYAASHNAASVQ